MSVAPPRDQNQKHFKPQNVTKSEYSSSDIKKSSSFANLTSSSLSSVFGSSTSLAELTGDDFASSFKPPVKPHTHANPNLTHHVPHSSFLSIALKYSILFIFGIGYGQFVKNLHDNQQVKSHIFDLTKTPILFAFIWGLHGIFLSTLLPYFDSIFPSGSLARKNADERQKQTQIDNDQDDDNDNEDKESNEKGGNDWVSIVRASTAFIGLAYGVRKLSWDSSTQVAFLWSCVNPFLWYILDGSRNGFVVSSLTAIVEAAGFAIFAPSHLPPFHTTSYSVYCSVVVWIASVFFCCSLCFGNLGRRLHKQKQFF